MCIRDRYLEKRLGIEARPLNLISTTLVAKYDEVRIRDCGREILKIAKVPGFSYSKKMIMREIMKFGFSRSEIDSALKMLIEQKFLEAQRGEKGFQTKLGF